MIGWIPEDYKYRFFKFRFPNQAGLTRPITFSKEKAIREFLINKKPIDSYYSASTFKKPYNVEKKNRTFYWYSNFPFDFDNVPYNIVEKFRKEMSRRFKKWIIEVYPSPLRTSKDSYQVVYRYNIKTKNLTPKQRKRIYRYAFKRIFNIMVKKYPIDPTIKDIVSRVIRLPKTFHNSGIMSDFTDAIPFQQDEKDNSFSVTCSENNKKAGRPAGLSFSSIYFSTKINKHRQIILIKQHIDKFKEGHIKSIQSREGFTEFYHLKLGKTIYSICPMSMEDEKAIRISHSRECEKFRQSYIPLRRSDLGRPVYIGKTIPDIPKAFAHHSKFHIEYLKRIAKSRRDEINDNYPLVERKFDNTLIGRTIR